MRAKDAMRLLGVSRITLYRYLKNGLITATKLHNGYYDYDQQSILKLAKKSDRITVIYARVSTYKQKSDLQNQIDSLKLYCKKNKIKYNCVISEIASGMTLERTNFSNLLDDILSNKIDAIIISHKDRLTRLSFSILEHIFNKFNTKIIVTNKSEDKFGNEYFNDILALMHTFSIKMYSKRKNT